MTFQTFKRFVLMSVFFMTTSVVIYAQQFTMQGLIGQSLAKLQQPTSESILNCIAEMKRINDMFPDSIQPKFQIALQSLNYSVMNPHAPQTENLLKETEETIAKMENIKHADPSDICTLRGFSIWYASYRILGKRSTLLSGSDAGLRESSQTQP